MKILCIGRSPSGGGAARVQNTLLDHLRHSAFDACRFYLDPEAEPGLPASSNLSGERGKRTSTDRGPSMASVIRRLCKLAKSCDIVFGMQDGRPIDLAILIGIITRRPAIGWVHNLPSRSHNDFPGCHPWVSRLLYPRAARMIAVSQGVAEDLARWSPETRAHSVALPNPIDVLELRRLSEQPPPAWAASVFARKTLLAMGWLIRRKGFDLLLRAFATLVRSGHDLNLLILGEGEERRALETQVEDLALGSRVFMPGYAANPYPLLSRAEAFVLSSRYEGLPTVLLEAMTLGVPVVSFDCPSGPADILEDGRCGRLAPPEDTEAMAVAIHGLLSSPALRASFRERGFERAMQYDARVVTRRFEALFLETANGHGRRARRHEGKDAGVRVDVGDERASSARNRFYSETFRQ